MKSYESFKWYLVPVNGGGQSPWSAKMAKVGDRKANVPPCMMGNL